LGAARAAYPQVDDPVLKIAEFHSGRDQFQFSSGNKVQLHLAERVVAQVRKMQLAREIQLLIGGHTTLAAIPFALSICPASANGVRT